MPYNNNGVTCGNHHAFPDSKPLANPVTNTYTARTPNADPVSNAYPFDYNSATNTVPYCIRSPRNNSNSVTNANDTDSFRPSNWRQPHPDGYCLNSHADNHAYADINC